MTERKGDVRPEDPPPTCGGQEHAGAPMIQLHLRRLCGIARAPARPLETSTDEERRRAGSQANGQPSGG